MSKNKKFSVEVSRMVIITETFEVEAKSEKAAKEKAKKAAYNHDFGSGDEPEYKVESVKEISEEEQIEKLAEDIANNWDNYRKEFTDNKKAKAKDYKDAIYEYAQDLFEISQNNN